MILRTAAFALTALGLTACVSAPKQDLTAINPGAFQVEKSHASLTFQVKHFGLSWYTMRFNEFDIALDFNPDAPEASFVEAIVDPTSIDVWHPEKTEEWNQELALDDKFLDAEAYPQIVFRSTEIKVTGENTGTVTGDLTLKGITKPIEMDVIFNGSNSSPFKPGVTMLGFSATGSFNRSDFGLDAYVGNIVSDETRFAIEVEFEETT